MRKAWWMALTVGSCVALSGAAMARGAKANEAGARHGGHGRAGMRERLVERMDLDRNGEVTRTESRQAAVKRFAEMDRNGDGTLSEREVRDGRLAAQKQHLAARFGRLDVDRDGRLTPSESKMPERRFRRIDENHDGAITRAEMQAAADRRRARQQERHAGKNRGGKSDGKSDGKAKGKPKGKAKGKPGKGSPAQGHWGGFFRSLDANADGKVTRDEALAASARRFARLDANGDGVLRGDELERSGRPHGKKGRGAGQRRGKR